MTIKHRQLPREVRLKKIAQAKKLSKQGKSNRKIATIIGVSHTMVGKYLRQQ
jgi:predicted transcriptional regulator